MLTATHRCPQHLVALTAQNTRERVRLAGKAVPWLQSLDPVEYDQLMMHARLVRHVRNDRLMRQGHEAGQLMVLLTGQVHAERKAHSDRHVLLQVARAYNSLGDASLIDGAPIEADYRVVKDCVAISFQRQAFINALRQSADFCNTYAAHLSGQVRAANARLAMLACAPVEERVYSVLSAWSSRNAAGQWVVDEPVSQQDLAMVVAASREMTCRALAQLKLKGQIWYDRWQQVVVRRDHH